MTIRQIAAIEYGGGYESAGAETRLWAELPTMPIEAVVRLVRSAPLDDRFRLVVAAVQGGSADRAAGIKRLFAPEEIAEMKVAAARGGPCGATTERA